MGILMLQWHYKLELLLLVKMQVIDLIEAASDVCLTFATPTVQQASGLD